MKGIKMKYIVDTFLWRLCKIEFLIDFFQGNESYNDGIGETPKINKSN